MAPLAERVREDEEVFAGSLEAIEVVQELERRRALVQEGTSQLLSEQESWASIRAAGYHV